MKAAFGLTAAKKRAICLSMAEIWLWDPIVALRSGRRPARAMCRALSFLIAFWAVVPAVMAQDLSPAEFFRADRERLRLLQRPVASTRPGVVQRPTHLIRHSAPVRGFSRDAPVQTPEASAPAEPPSPGEAGPAPADSVPAPAAPAQTVDGAPPLPAAAPPEPAPPADVTPVVGKSAEPTFYALVIGDSLGQQLGQGLTEAFADQPEVSILRKARENTGIVRDDYFDWVKGARDSLAGAGKVDIAIMMIGSNDRQPLRDGAATVDLHQPRWKDIYGDRVEAIAKTFRDRKIPFVWVGLPAMKSDRFSADMSYINDIYRDRAGKVGAVFVDTWEDFLDDRGLYAAYGPDLNGVFQKLRAGDGVHFTRPGARKLAHFVESEIHHAIEDAHPGADPLAAVTTLAPPLIAAPEPPAPVAPAPSVGEAPRAPARLVVALPAPVEPPQVVIPVKPLAGQVAPLTGPVVSPGGELVKRVSQKSGVPGSQTAVERVLGQGQELEARPGRADDFKWPRDR